MNLYLVFANHGLFNRSQQDRSRQVGGQAVRSASGSTSAEAMGKANLDLVVT